MADAQRIYVAGHAGLVGSALTRRLRRAGVEPLMRTRGELDLSDARAVDAFFAEQRPTQVYLAAALVGGIHANSTRPAEFYRVNSAIQLSVIDAAWRHGVERLLFLGSSCIYPRDCPQPIREDYLLTGPLERSNRAYALAKIGGIEMCADYNRQYGSRFLAAMPTNLYGPGDNYDALGSHVLPALIRRFHLAARRGDAQVTAWGSGTPRREFLYSDDLADACVFLMGLPDTAFDALLHADWPLINIGCGEDLSIRELTERIAQVVGFTGAIDWDASKPDGTPRKLLEVSRINALGWKAATGLEEGLRLAYRDFLSSRWAAEAESAGLHPA